jgi:hypothetical protein
MLGVLGTGLSYVVLMVVEEAVTEQRLCARQPQANSGRRTRRVLPFDP